MPSSRRRRASLPTSSAFLTGESQIPASLLTSAWYLATSGAELWLRVRWASAAAANMSFRLRVSRFGSFIARPPRAASDRLGRRALQGLTQEPRHVEDERDPAVPED